MRLRFPQLLVASFVVACVVAPAATARAAVITVDFSGTYDTHGDNVFGESGSAVPFHYSLTYDTAADTNTVFVAAGTLLPNGLTAQHDFYGYSASGIVATMLTFGTQTWTVAGLEPKSLGGGLSADLFFDTDLALAMPTRSAMSFASPNGTLTLGFLSSNATDLFIRMRTDIAGAARADGDLQIGAPTVPEPMAFTLLAIGLGGMALRRKGR